MSNLSDYFTSLKESAERVFGDCKALENVEFAEEVDSNALTFAWGCFYNCTALRSVKFPNRGNDKVYECYFHGGLVS